MLKGVWPLDQILQELERHKMDLLFEGLVGIGVSAPEHALHVNGSIQAKSIVGKSDSDSVSGIGIKGIAESGAGIGIQSTGSKIGIDVDAPRKLESELFLKEVTAYLLP